MATWSNWKSIDSKSYVFETTLGAILRDDTTTQIPLNEVFFFTHNLHLSNPEDYICVIEMAGQFMINNDSESVTYTISKQLVGINTSDFAIGGYAKVNSEKTVKLLLAWNISVHSENVTFSFTPKTDVSSFSVGNKASCKVKIYLFKP